MNNNYNGYNNFNAPNNQQNNQYPQQQNNQYSQQNNYNQPPNSQMHDNFNTNPYNQNSYNYIEQESMEDFYNYKQGKTKIILMIVGAVIIFTFILGLFTTPFINGTPVYLTESARDVIDYSETIKDKTMPLLTQDDDYYNFFVALKLNTSSSGIMTDAQISSEIASMDKIISELDVMAKAKQVPPGFDGPGGLHDQLIILMKERTKRLNDLRNISQGEGKDPKVYNEEYLKYIAMRDDILHKYNAKYEVNFKKVLFDMKELKFNVQ